MSDAYVLVISPDEVAKMLEDADFSEIETKIIAVRLDTLRRAGLEYKGSRDDVLKRLGDKEYYDEKKVYDSSDRDGYAGPCGVWVE